MFALKTKKGPLFGKKLPEPSQTRPRINFSVSLLKFPMGGSVFGLLLFGFFSHIIPPKKPSHRLETRSRKAMSKKSQKMTNFDTNKWAK